MYASARSIRGASRESDLHQFTNGGSPGLSTLLVGYLTLDFEYELDRLFQVLSRLVERLALGDGAWHFFTLGNPPAVFGLLQDRGKGSFGHWGYSLQFDQRRRNYAGPAPCAGSGPGE